MTLPTPIAVIWWVLLAKMVGKVGEMPPGTTLATMVEAVGAMTLEVALALLRTAMWAAMLGATPEQMVEVSVGLSSPALAATMAVIREEANAVEGWT